MSDISVKVCGIDGCERKHKARGFCDSHYKRLKKFGDAGLAAFRVKGTHGGDDIQYKSAHRRVRDRRGPARGYLCVDCGVPAEEWSYDHQDPNQRFEWKADQAGAWRQMFYSTSPDHYEARCKACHREFDLSR